MWFWGLIQKTNEDLQNQWISWKCCEKLQRKWSSQPTYKNSICLQYSYSPHSYSLSPIMKTFILCLAVWLAYAGTPFCNTVYDQQCRDEPRQQCKFELKPFTTTQYEQECHSVQVPFVEQVPEQKCRNVSEQKCHTSYEQECSTRYEQKCNTEMKQEQHTTYEQKCDNQYEHVKVG